MPSDDPGHRDSSSVDGRTIHFENVFADEDPWQYDEPYEVLKYKQTIGLCKSRHYETALEVGCAEGHFTLRLAEFVDQVTALDIAPTAVDRAQARLNSAGAHNVTVDRLDLVTDDLSTTADLVVCSETLYFMGDRAGLDQALRKLSACVLDGGDLVMAHAFDASLRDGKPGFGWRMDIDAGTISDLMAKIPGMALAERLDSDIYRIERYRRTAAPIDPSLRYVATDRAGLEPKIGRMVLWDGYSTTPQEAEAETSEQIPVLMYHSIADSGPEELAPYRVSVADFEAQCEFLRLHGYRGISPRELINLVLHGKRPNGRRVMFTFDDGYQDFEEHAWPILDSYGLFGSVVFMPTARIGATADWDEAHTSPPPLLSEQSITRLAGKGVFFGSHAHDHQKLTQIDDDQISDDLRRSRERLQELTGQQVPLFAYPFGDFDARVIEHVRDAGFELAFGTGAGFTRHGDPPMKLQRIHVDGTLPALESLRALLG